MSLKESLRKRASALKKNLAALYYAYRNPTLPLAPRLLILLTLGYALSPIDLIPDFIPVLGYLDDLILVPALIALAIRLIPPDIMDKARADAEEKPLRLSKNWSFGVFVIIVWIALAAWIASMFI